MSDREGQGSGGPDDDLSLPKATVYKVISGMCFVAVHSNNTSVLMIFVSQIYYHPS